MVKKRYDTIIVGGGIAGLACARKLYEKKRSFMIISHDIGGRIITSKNKKVNYGAYLTSSYYNNFNKYIKLGRPVYPNKLELHLGKKRFSIFNWYFVRYFGEAIRFYGLLYKFAKEYKKFRELTQTISQKEAIEGNKFLHQLYKQPAEELVKNHRIENIVRKVIAQPVYAITFSSIRDGTAFPFLHACLLIHSNMHEFEFNFKKITKGFRKEIIHDEISSIKRKQEMYVLKGKNRRSYKAENVVIATPINISKRLLNLKKINQSINCYMYHIEGMLKDKWCNEEFQLFCPNHNVAVIAHQKDGSFLVYSKKKANLSRYFKQYKILFQKYWSPAFTVPGPILLDCEQGGNLYMIGDYNICGLEDSFITGIYAANCIIKKEEKK